MKTFTRNQRILLGGLTSACYIKLLFILLCCFLYSISVKAQDHAGAFITIWDTDKMSADTHLEVPSTGTNYSYYWENVGDPGINAGGNYITQSGNLSIPSIPNNTGKYRLYIKGNYTAIRMEENVNSALALSSIESWGNIVWSTMASAFRGCANLANIPIAAPDLSQVTSLRYMFDGASTFNDPVDHWNTSNVTDMSYMFSGALAFNQPMANWNVESVTNLAGMFNSATAFNQNIGNWQLKEGVSLIYFLNRCGMDCENYGLTLKGWAQNSNTPQNLTLDAVDVRYASDALVFRDALENDKGWTFSDAGESFGCSIYSIIDHTNAFITVWDTEKMAVDTHLEIPSTGGNYGYYWEKVDNVAINSGSYQPKSGTLTLNTLMSKSGTYRIYIRGSYSAIKMSENGNTAKALTAVESWGNMVWSNMNGAFRGCSNLVSLPAAAPNLTLVTSMANMFNGASSFNSPINNWNTSNVTNMNGMFSGAIAFNQPVGSWNTSNVTSMSSMFSGASAFNAPINNWNTSNVTSMSYMFKDASVFNNAVDNWNTSNVTDMSFMFSGAIAFNQPVGSLNTSKVTNIGSMFSGASSFNSLINDWNTSNVTNMNNMFAGASSFNSAINDWNTSSVTNMKYMFSGASSFNSPINDWNTSKVTDMSFMFSGAAAFNQTLLNWNFEKVTDMSGMFNSATAFNQNLGSWQLKEGVNLVYFFNRSGIDCENYGLTLKGWAQNPSTPDNLTLNADTRQYASDALPYRNILVAKGWTINDGGVASGCNLPLPVTLVKYGVKLQAGTVLISWQTVAEVNNSHFVLERSTDGIRFSFLKQIAAGFGGNAASNYSYTDAYPDNGNNYYRLTQVDLDGTAHNHGIRSVNVPLNKESAIVYPNPVSHLPVTVKFKPNLYDKASLFNVNGLLIDFKNIIGSDQPVRFDTQQLPPGMYVIKLSGKETSVHQFIKQ